MGIIRAILSSKVTTLLALVAALIGVATDPQFAGLIPENASAFLATIGSIVAAITKGLADKDGDGVPDIIQ